MITTFCRPSEFLANDLLKDPVVVKSHPKQHISTPDLEGYAQSAPKMVD